MRRCWRKRILEYISDSRLEGSFSSYECEIIASDRKNDHVKHDVACQHGGKDSWRDSRGEHDDNDDGIRGENHVRDIVCHVCMRAVKGYVHDCISEDSISSRSNGQGHDVMDQGQGRKWDVCMAAVGADAHECMPGLDVIRSAERHAACHDDELKHELREKTMYLCMCVCIYICIYTQICIHASTFS
jgi:hypothetical protein